MEIKAVWEDSLTGGRAEIQEHTPAGSNFRSVFGKKTSQSGFYIKYGTLGKHRGQKPSPLSRSILLFRTPRIAWNSTGRPRIERYPMIATRTSTAREKA